MAIEWKNGASCAVMLSFDLDGETLWMARDPALAERPIHMSMGAYGPKTAMPCILRLLDRYDLKVGFYVPGWIIEHYPAVVEEIVRKGHEVGHHGYLHEKPFFLQGPEEEEALLVKTLAIFEPSSLPGRTCPVPLDDSSPSGIITAHAAGQSVNQPTPDPEEANMADEVQRVEYFYVMVPNKPGEGARYLAALKDAGINLWAFSGFPEGRGSQLDFVPADPAAFRRFARSAKWKVTGPKRAFLITGGDRVGAIADVHAKLAAANVNVTAIDAVCGGNGRYGAILWVTPRDVNKAARLLGAA